VTGMMRARLSRPVKSAGLVVYSGSPSASAVAAIIRSTTLPRVCASGDDRCLYAAEDAGRLGVEWHRVKFAFSALYRSEQGLAGSWVLLCDSVPDQFGSGPDAELAEDFVQVVVDGARAQEQLGSDIAVSKSFCHEPGNFKFLRGELVEARGSALAGGLASGA
jgi:hypothetical protein